MKVVIYTTSDHECLNKLMEETKALLEYDPFRETIGWSFNVKNSTKELAKFSKELEKLPIEELLIRIVLEDLNPQEFRRIAKVLVKPELKESEFVKLLKNNFESFKKSIVETPGPAVGLGAEV